MRLGFNIAMVSIITTLCITIILVVALANGINGVLVTSGIASLIGIPTFVFTKLTIERKYKSKDKGE